MNRIGGIILCSQITQDSAPVHVRERDPNEFGPDRHRSRVRIVNIVGLGGNEEKRQKRSKGLVNIVSFRDVPEVTCNNGV